MRDAARRLPPDFRAGAAIVCPPVVVVGELVQHPAPSLGLHGQRQIARTLHALFLRDQHQLGPVGLHRLAAFQALGLGHDQHHPVALHRCHHGQRNAGVAGRGLDQRVAGPDLATRLGSRDHRQRRPILHGTGRIVAFQLGQHADTGCLHGRIHKTRQRHQRGIADLVENGSAVGHQPEAIHPIGTCIQHAPRCCVRAPFILPSRTGRHRARCVPYRHQTGTVISDSGAGTSSGMTPGCSSFTRQSCSSSTASTRPKLLRQTSIT